MASKYDSNKKRSYVHKNPIAKTENIVNDETCGGCLHYRTWSGAIKCCNYTFDTGNLRQGPIANCPHKRIVSKKEFEIYVDSLRSNPSDIY